MFVRLDKTEFDFGVCTTSTLYQDQIEIRNESNYAKKITFKIPKEIESQVQIFPSAGYVQDSELQILWRFGKKISI